MLSMSETFKKSHKIELNALSLIQKELIFYIITGNLESNVLHREEAHCVCRKWNIFAKHCSVYKQITLDRIVHMLACRKMINTRHEVKTFYVIAFVGKRMVKKRREYEERQRLFSNQVDLMQSKFLLENFVLDYQE